MQPEEQQDFKPPEETAYVPVAPEVSPVATPEIEVPVTEPVAELPASPEAVEEPEEAAPAPMEPVHWKAAEYHYRDRGFGWYAVLALVTVVLTGLAIYPIKSWTFAILVPVMAIALVVYVRRPPTQIDYAISDKGLFINDTLHSFHEFRAFGVMHDGHEFSVSLIPVRRFRPSLSVYFPEESGEQIVDVLGVRLPMQEVKPDAFDRIVRLLRI